MVKVYEVSRRYAVQFVYNNRYSGLLTDIKCSPFSLKNFVKFLKRFMKYLKPILFLKFYDTSYYIFCWSCCAVVRYCRSCQSLKPWLRDSRGLRSTATCYCCCAKSICKMIWGWTPASREWGDELLTGGFFVDFSTWRTCIAYAAYSSATLVQEDCARLRAGRFRTRTNFGDRALNVAVARDWNYLPPDLAEDVSFGQWNQSAVWAPPP